MSVLHTHLSLYDMREYVSTYVYMYHVRMYVYDSHVTSKGFFIYGTYLIETN